ncbi:glycosyltransferase [Cupriavidus sp.]|uniref:glycosyltransferase n=1 Tax=Cupriavidus sp. TaxID=1873897 RepID=UPI0025C07077|nr:glycosyltransferase [Cupriavidus sp.]MCA3184723.1 glycosyltransferase [Cupriavidus sp.]MCA3193064.1 glycosyltransferase [Cupriavidus sp.]MCA3195916.1 glycosyltransferase [Cupriavidus sp.]MCA3204817.1 glycosyltransferase [Cupriavidus sp.]MCA3206970.1 glycosyltransferase [Cupriavidus sp.]
MRKQRILFHVTHFLHGGIETSLVSLLTSLQDRFDLALTVTYPSPELESHFRARLPASVKVHVLAPERWLSHCRQLKKQRKLGVLGKIYEEVLLPPVRKPVVRRRFMAILEQGGFDMVVDYDMSLSRITGPLPVPMIGYQHFSVAHLARGHGRKLRKLRHQCKVDYDAVVMLTDSMLADARELMPDAASRLVRLYNAIDLDNIRARAAQPLEPGLVPAGPFIVSVGRLEESQKDFTSLLHAYARLVKQGIEERLVLVGDGASRPRLEALAKSLGLGDRVIFAGFQSNPYAWIGQARLMAFSSKMEGLPNVLLEGLAVGQVVVSTDCPTGPREILDDGRAGLLVPVGDVEGLAEAIRSGLQDEALRQTLLAHAARHIEQMGFGPTGQAFGALVSRLTQADVSPAAAAARA